MHVSPQRSRFILASASPRRLVLLRQLGLRPRVRVSRVVEPPPAGDPAAYVLRAARDKVRDVAARLKRPAWILGADTVVVAGGRVLGKPADRREAGCMLRRLSGRTHRVLTGVALRHHPTGPESAWVERTSVRMRAIPASALAAYLAGGEWRDKAGAYAIQGRAAAWITGVQGCYFNVVGLPLGSLAARLSRFGCRGF